MQTPLVSKPPLKLFLAHPEQANSLFQVLATERQHLSDQIPWVDMVKTRKDVHRFLLEAGLFHKGGQQMVTFIYWEEKLVGSISLMRIDKRHRVGEIGFWMIPPYRGRGIMSDSTRLFVSYIFDHINLNRLEIRIPLSNSEACHIPKALGFKHEGTLRQAVRRGNQYQNLLLFGLIKSDWRR